MRIDVAGHWLGSELPETLARRTWPCEMSAEEIVALAESFDVSIVHVRQPQPTRRERARGAPDVPDQIVLFLDVRGGRFHQR